MTNKYTRSRYKGIKWINTRYAKPYIIRMGWKRIQAAMILSQSLSTISMIKSASFDGGAQRVNKAMAIAETVVSAVSAVNNISWYDKAAK